MKITEIKTYLMQAAKGDDAWSQRNWLFVKVITDEGIYGVGRSERLAARRGNRDPGPECHPHRGRSVPDRAHLPEDHDRDDGPRHDRRRRQRRHGPVSRWRSGI